MLEEEDAAAVGERAEEADITRPEWVRRAVSAALCRGLYRLGTLDVLEPVPAPCDDVQQYVSDIDKLLAQIVELEATIDTLTGENLALGQDRIEALQRASEGDKEIATLNRLLDERKDEVNWLRAECSKLNDKLAPALLPEHAGPIRRWWRFW